MPRYDYKCNPCLLTEEKTHPMSESPEYQCANCGGTMKKVITPTPALFKGSGWAGTTST